MNDELGELEIVRGKLPDVVEALEVGTIQHSDQICKARTEWSAEDDTERTYWKKPIRTASGAICTMGDDIDTAEIMQTLRTADGAIYTVEDGEVYLHLTRGRNNPVFGNIDEAARQLTERSFYKVRKGDVLKYIEAEDTITVKLSDLGLEPYLPERDDSFVIDLNKPEDLNPAQLEVAERAYGSGSDGERYMNDLREAGLERVRVCTFRDSYVKEHANRDEALVTLCSITSSQGYQACSYFVTNMSITGFDSKGKMRGVLDYQGLDAY